VNRPRGAAGWAFATLGGIPLVPARRLG